MDPPDWRSDAAPENQLEYLRSFGIEPKPGITNGEASDLIDKAKNDPVALERQQQLRATEWDRRREEEVKFPSFYLRGMIESARQELNAAKGEHGGTRKELAALRRRLAAAEQRQERDLLNDAIVDEIQAIKREINSMEGQGDTSSLDYVKDAKGD